MRFPRPAVPLATLAIFALGAGAVWATCPGPSCPSGRSNIAGAIIGGAISGAIINNQSGEADAFQRAGKRTATVREQSKTVQTALNYFGFDAGRPDGAIGPRTRAAISEYQEFTGTPVTGVLAPEERGALLAAYAQAQRGGAEDMQLADRRTGLQRTVAEWSSDTTRTTTAAVAAPGPQPLPRLTSVFGDALGGKSLVSMCNELVLNADTVSDDREGPDAARLVVRRLCDLRKSAMEEGVQLTRSIAGLSDARIAEQCASLASNIASRLPPDWSSAAPETTLGIMKQRLAIEKPEDYESTAAVCAFVGFRRDDPEMVMASALLGSLAGASRQTETVALLLAASREDWTGSPQILSWFERADATSAAQSDSDDTELRTFLDSLER